MAEYLIKEMAKKARRNRETESNVYDEMGRNDE